MGVLDQLLAGVDNTKRVVGRNMSDMVSDPRLYAEKIVGALRNQNAGVKPVAADGELTNRPMTREEIANSYIDNFAGAGIIKAHPPTVFEQRHLVAQRNAALPVEQGGLGLGPQNTAMERARALEYEKGWAHGSPNPDLTELRAGKYGAEGRGVYASDYMPEAGTYAGKKEGATIYPLMVRRNKTIETDAGLDAYQKMNAFSDDALSEALKAKGLDSITARQPENPQWLIDAGAIPMPERRHFVSENAANFRSPFAAFDPMRRHEADILGFANPQLLGGMALGSGGILAAPAIIEALREKK